MITKTFVQPESQLGAEFSNLLATDRPYKKIIFVSAFTALRTILRLRDELLRAKENQTEVRLILGIDLKGTSREVLQELLSWNCNVNIYHNPNPRVTFHPKLYLFERESDSHLFIGSNNLTDGGLYTNYEVSTKYSFEFPEDKIEYERILNPLKVFLQPEGPIVRILDNHLIEILSQRDLLATEVDARRNRKNYHVNLPEDTRVNYPNPFTAMPVKLPPLLPRDVRIVEPHGIIEEVKDETISTTGISRPVGLLVWQKVLPRTDALQVQPGSHHVGGVRLTQAGFENPIGQPIDQTTYFRTLFDDFDWENEPHRHADQEHTFIPMRIIIRHNDYGIRNFEISHKPSGEAGQDNYTTILRWGRIFNGIIEQENLTGTTFSLYETPDSDAPFFIEISNPQ